MVQQNNKEKVMLELKNDELQVVVGGVAVGDALWAAGGGATSGGATGAGIGFVLGGPGGAVAGGAIGIIAGTFIGIYDYLSDTV